MKGVTNCRVLSCVPRQHTTTFEKIEWLQHQANKHSPDLIVTPQEFFGGVVMMSHKPTYTKEELLPILSSFCSDYNCGLVVGLLQHDKEDNKNREVIWFIDRDGTYLGRVCKFALPRYDLVKKQGSGNVTPETDINNRFVTFNICGLRAVAVFCWEVYSNVLWTGLSLLKPDVVFNLIKFGPNAWPVVKRVRGLNTVVDFGYGSWSEDGGWIERLRVACKWQVKCPIISSTNSWNLKPRSMPICGTICEIPGQALDTLTHPTKEQRLKEIPELEQIDEINPTMIQAALKSKWTYRDAVGTWPPWSLSKYTMMLKINTVEHKILLAGRKKSKRSSSSIKLPTFGLLDNVEE